MTSSPTISWCITDGAVDFVPVLKLIDQGVRSSVSLGSGKYSGIIMGRVCRRTTTDGRTASGYVAGILWGGETALPSMMASFQFYPDCGFLRFSDPKYPDTYVPAQSSNFASISPFLVLADWSSESTSRETSDWVYDGHHKKHRLWDGSKWIWEKWE